jgi:hypothetical protein
MVGVILFDWVSCETVELVSSGDEPEVLWSNAAHHSPLQSLMKLRLL